MPPSGTQTSRERASGTAEGESSASARTAQSSLSVRL
jgi:hypothetical protein